MRYFTLEELEHSDTATKYKIDNTANGDTRTNLTKLIELLLDPIRTKWGKPIKVNSGYRCSKLNRIVGGVSTSQHVLGEAADITVGSSEENKRLFEMIISMNILFDQLIQGRYPVPAKACLVGKVQLKNNAHGLAIIQYI